MMNPISTHLIYPTHCIAISLRSNGDILCFKYDHCACDFDQFQYTDSELHRLAHYMTEPIDPIQWGFKPDSEQE
jgi:hypothetical protein